VIDLSRKTVLFWDSQGSYLHIAESVVEDFAAVKYYVPWERGFPVTIDALPGVGVDGIERSLHFWDDLETADLVVFTDVGNNGLQEYLRSQGMPVFGSGAAGRIEQDRGLLKSVCKKVGIGVAEYLPIRGVDNLRALLMESDDECYIKVSYWRGLAETYHHTSPFATKYWLDDVSLRAGPYGSMVDFIIEKPISGDPCVEIGFDTYTADGMYPETIAYGYEAKDAAFVLNIAPLPKRLRAVADKFQPILSEYGYRGPISTEVRFTKDEEYFVDLTARFPEPPSSLQSFMVANMGEILWETANGRIVEPDYIAPIGVELVMKSSWAAEHPLAVQVGRWDRTRIHGHCVIDGQHYASSPAELEEFGAACGMGSTLEAAMADALDAAHEIEAFQASFESSALEELTETIQKGRKVGLTW
jgi:hypothetical protein